MSLGRLVYRSFVDLVDIPALVVTLLLVYIVNFFVAVPLLSATTDALSTYIFTGSFLKASYAFFTSLKDPITLLSFLLVLFFNTYLLGFLIARLWQKRTGEALNPFVVALKKIVHVFLVSIFVSSLPAIFLILYLVQQAVPPWNTLWLVLTILSLVTWVPLSLPVLTVVVVEKGRGRDLVYEGLLAGKVYWWKNLVVLLLGSIVFYLLALLLAPVPAVITSTLISSLEFILLAAVAVESYYGFKHGE